jgi:chemotaxis protein MotB
MRRMKLSTVLGVLALSAGLVSLSGCGQELQDLRLANRMQQDTINRLTGELEAAKLELDQCNKKLSAAEQTGGVELDALKQKLAALEEDVAKKEQLIKTMQAQLLGGSPLPVELSTALEDFAKQNADLIEYDSDHGLVKFKSDLLFEKGSDQVVATAQEAIRTLCGILNSQQAQQFDIIVAGHTDDIPIRRAATQAAHPTNWHLSVHRAIAVLLLMESDGVNPARMRACGFGEYRPVEANAPNKGGNPKNRRVEIYIVPKGA